jgi:predicted Zn-dependent peptidase
MKMKPDFYKIKLKSGATLLFEKRKLPVTTIIAATRAGAAYETEKDKGIAHFTEHMLFKGSTNRSQQEFSSTLEKVGAIINGFTAEQITAFYCKLPSKHNALGADCIFDFVKNPKFDENEIEKERKVIISEIDMHHDWPRSYVLRKIKEAMYEKPFSLPILGLKETVSSFNRNTFLRWHNFYNPNNLIFSIVGKGSIEEIQEIAKKYFSEEKKSSLPEISLKKMNSEFIEERQGLDQTHFCLGFHVPSLSEKQRYTSEVFNAILGEGMSSVLHQEIREKRGLAYAIKSFLDQEKSFGYCVVYAGIEKKNLKKVKEIVPKEIKNITKINKKDLEEAKEQKIGNWQVELEDSEKVAASLIIQEIATKAEDFYNYDEKISEVKLQQVREMAKIGNYSTAILVPK